MASSSHRVKGNDSAGASPAGRTTTYCVVLSVLLHLALLVAMVFVPDLAPAKRIVPSVVSVSLVTLPAAGSPSSPAPAAVKMPAKPQPTERLRPPSPKATEKVAVPASKFKPKTSLKHKTFKSEKVVKSAVERIEEKLVDSRPPSLENTLDRLKREVAETPENPRGGTPTSPEGQSPVGAGTSGGPQLSSGEIADGIRIYQAEISYQVQKNWAFSEQLAGADKNLEVLIGIRIAPDGRIIDTWFDQRSGNRHLDESAQRAVMKASPLPPLPKGIFNGDYTVGLRFGPEGIKR